MKLHVLGCGDAFGSGGRNASAYWVETEDRRFLLDCGPTTLPALKRVGFDPQRLDAIFITHLHGDHYGGLPFFLIEYLYESPRAAPLHIAGPEGTEERVRNLFGLMFGDGRAPRDLPPTVFHLLQPDQETRVQGIEVFPFRVPHQVREISLALKITYAGKQILYSGDSAWTDLFIEHSRGVDLFLCECCFFDRDTPNHMSYRKISENYSRLRCRQLILTHLGVEMLARRSELPVRLAEDGMVVDVGSLR